MCYKPLHEPIYYASSLKSYEIGPQSSYIFSEDGMRNEKGSRWATSRGPSDQTTKGGPLQGSSERTNAVCPTAALVESPVPQSTFTILPSILSACPAVDNKPDLSKHRGLLGASAQASFLQENFPDLPVFGPFSSSALASLKLCFCLSSNTGSSWIVVDLWGELRDRHVLGIQYCVLNE